MREYRPRGQELTKAERILRDRPQIDRIKARTSIGERTLTANKVTIFWDQGSLVYKRDGEQAVLELATARIPHTGPYHKIAFEEKALEAMNQAREQAERRERRNDFPHAAE